MNKPTENQIKLIKSISGYIEYINNKENAEEWEVWDAVLKLQSLAKMFLENKWEEGSTTEYINLDSMKKIVEKMMENIIKYTNELEGKC